MESFAGIVSNKFARDTYEIEGWIDKLRTDKRIIISANSQAQSAIDFNLNIKWEEKEEEEKVEALPVDNSSQRQFKARH